MISAGRAERLSLSTWTLDRLSVSEVVRIAEICGYGLVELRMVDFLRSGNRTGDIAAVVRSGLAVSSLGADGSLLQPTPAAQRAWFDGLAEAAVIARETGATTVMVSTGMQGSAAPERAAALLGEAGALLAQNGLRLAYEFNAYHADISSLDQALDLIAAAGQDSIGLALDAYHLHLSGGGGSPALERLRASDILCVQVSDVPPPLARNPPADRLIPGDGAASWPEFFALLDGLGYAGPVALEAPNPSLWQEDPLTLATRGKAAILGLWDRSVDGRRAGL